MSRSATRCATVLLVAAALVQLAACGRGSRWERAAVPSLRSTQTNFFVNDLEAGRAPGSWLAGGYLIEPSGVRTPTIWTTDDDGSSWSAATVPVRPEWRDSARLHEIARRGDVVLALGGAPGREGDEEPVLWRSTAGGPWELLDEPSLGGPGFQAIGTLAAGPLGFVLAVTEHDQLGHPRAVFWYSGDGRTWTRAESPPETARPWIELLSAAVGADSMVVVGRQADEAGYADGLIWSSPDGEHWESIVPPVPFVGPGESQEIDAVVAFNGGFVAVGSAFHAARSAVSADGRTWEVLPPGGFAPDPLEIESGLLDGLVADGDRLLLLADDGSAPRLWLSFDGVTWAEQPLVTGDPVVLQPPLPLAAADGRVLLGLTGVNQGSVWLGEAGGAFVNVSDGSPAFPEPGSIVEAVGIASADDGTMVAVGSGGDDQTGGEPTSRALVWRSGDGRSWDAIEDESFDGASMAGVAGHGSALVAVGAAYLGGISTAAIWHSPDGRDWRRVVPGGDAGVPSGIVSIARRGDDLVAVGAVVDAGAVRPAAWTSTDGLAWQREFLGPQQGAALVACTDGRNLLVVGRSPAGAPLTWESDDGLAWRSHEAPFLLDGFRPRACALGPSRSLIVGDLDENPVVLSRAPSQDWQLVDAPQFRTIAPPRTLNAVLVVEDGFVVAGAESVGGQLDLGLWRSSDGQRWESMTVPPEVIDQTGLQEIRALLPVGGGDVVLAGHDGLGGGLWRGPLSQLR